jgi:hypothetical protein
MAQRVQTVLISDLSGDEVEAGRESVKFGYLGVDYVIDLTAKEAVGFEKAISMYVAHARKAGRTPRRGSSGGASGSSGNTGHHESISNLKRWATEQGIDYPKRGRLPKSLVDAYDAAH